MEKAVHPLSDLLKAVVSAMMATHTQLRRRLEESCYNYYRVEQEQRVRFHSSSVDRPEKEIDLRHSLRVWVSQTPRAYASKAFQCSRSWGQVAIQSAMSLPWQAQNWLSPPEALLTSLHGPAHLAVRMVARYSALASSRQALSVAAQAFVVQTSSRRRSHESRCACRRLRRSAWRC
jgi:hypothetical protein